PSSSPRVSRFSKRPATREAAPRPLIGAVAVRASSGSGASRGRGGSPARADASSMATAYPWVVAARATRRDPCLNRSSRRRTDRMADHLHELWRWLLSIPHLGLYLALVWLAYLVGLGGWIVLQKRAPVATLGWLLGLAALPYLGFLVYLVLGPQRIRRHRIRRARSRVSLSHEDVVATGEAELATLAHATSGLPASTARKVDLLVDGAATYDALLDAVRSARHHVHLEYYIYAADRTGTRLRDALAERARAGVAVRLLLDAVGSAGVPRRFFDPLLEAGGEVAWFHPMQFGKVWQRTWINLRSHRKIVVVD